MFRSAPAASPRAVIATACLVAAAAGTAAVRSADASVAASLRSSAATTALALAGQSETGQADTGRTDTGQTDTGRTEAGRTRTGQAGAPSKVVVLGFDGADFQLVRQWIDAGELPNLARLEQQGTFSPLLATNPPQTPVSWSTFTTGLDPGRHEIFDFLKRDPDTYNPDFAMATPTTVPFLFGERNPLYLAAVAALAVLLVGWLLVGGISRKVWLGLAAGVLLAVPAFVFARGFVAENIPVKRPAAINNRKGTPFWQLLSEQGIHSTVVRVPQTFPPDENEDGKLLAGLGTPDIRGTFGTYTYYTSEPFSFNENTEKGGKVVILDVEPGDTSVETIVYGPFNKLFDEPPEILLPLEVDFDWVEKTATLTVSDQTFTLREGQWSDWVRFEFPIRKVVKVHGISRFHLLEMGDRFRLYLGAINFDPTDPVVPITYPEGWSKEIHEKIGYWKTLGWACDTWALDEEVTNEEIYAQDTDMLVTKFEQIMENFITNPDDRLYVQIFYFTDRAGHMFWRFLDRENPAYDPALVDRWGDYILESYKRMDSIVGKAMATLPPDGEILVCSDHGFSTWRRSFNINTWLVRNGFMTLKGQDDKMKTLDDLFVEGTFWPNVDWTRTRAYALGLGCIYVNLLGREREGIVQPGAEYDQLCRDIRSGLEAFVDSTTGLPPVHRVYHRDEMYSDYDPDLIPDLRAANSMGYRVSWQTSLGGVPKDYFEDHESKWSGDHCSLDPSLVPGILFSSRPLALEETPNIVDLYPTILDLFDAEVPAGLDGGSLLPQ